MGGMPKIHSPEIVPYADGRILMRCHGCGARLWAGDMPTAERLAKFHGRGSFEEHGARQVHAVAVKKDTGHSDLIEFESAHGALGYINAQMSRGSNGYTFAYLTGYATPEHLLNALAAGPAKETPALESGKPELPAGEIVDAEIVE